MTSICPDCGHKLYNEADNKTGITCRTCYNCGYYEEDSEGYRRNPELVKQLFKKWFPTETRWLPSKTSPETGQAFKYPEDGTEPCYFV